MNKNLQSPTKLTEFAPLQPEEKQQTVGHFISKFFKISRSTVQEELSPNTQEKNSDNVSQESLPTWAIDPAAEDSHSRNDSYYQVDISEGRSLPNVLKRISNLLALKSSNLQAYSDTELKQYWMPDSVSKECYECCEKFTTFRRRHHCRVCGQIFCSQCCNQQIPGKIFGCTGDLRVCTYCCKVVLSYLQSPDLGIDLTADLKALQESLQNKYGALSPSSAPSSYNMAVSNTVSTSSIEIGNTLRRKVSVGYQEEKFALGRSASGNYLSPEEKCRVLQNSVSLRNLYEELCRPATGVPLQSHKYRLRTYSGCFLGSELVEWLIYQQKANTRVQAAAICQALLEGGYIECLSEPSSFIDGYTLYKPGIILSEPLSSSLSLQDQPNHDEPSWMQQIPQESCQIETKEISPNSRNQGHLTASSSYLLDLNLEANTVYLSRPPPTMQNLNSPNDSDSSDLEKHNIVCEEAPAVKTSEQREFVPESGWHNASLLRDENGEKVAYNVLTETFKLHEQNLLKQLLSAHGLPLSWSDVVVPLTHEIIEIIRPDKNHDAEELDIRQYVQYKKVSGGSRQDSKLIGGIVCSKNIAHKGMSTKLENPKILLLQCSVVYQRTEGRLMSLEPILMQEHEYLRHVVARIVALQPDLVLVQRNVSRLAQNLLRDQGITLVLNVKQSILERLARCTQADLVTSMDAHIGRPRLGTCKYFYLKSFDIERGGSKSLMFFEGLPQPHLGGTILLRGALKSELIRLKKVTLLFLLVCYNWRLEKSFLMDEFAQPPNSKDEFFEDSKENSPDLPNVMISDKINEKPKTLNTKSQKDNKERTVFFSDIENDAEVFNNHIPEKTSVVYTEIKTKSLVLEKTVLNGTAGDFSDPLSCNIDDEVFTSNSEILSVAELPFSNHFRKALDDTILCISPYLNFFVPYLETEIGRKCKLRNFFPTEIYYSKQFGNEKKTKLSKDGDNFGNFDNKLNNTQLLPPHPFITARIRCSADSNEIQTLLADFRAHGGRLEHKRMSSNAVVNEELTENQTKLRSTSDHNQLDVLDPVNHQRLAVLFCSFSHLSNNAPAFCVNPWVVYMDFYGVNDIPLGCFLERYCFRATYNCPSKTCDTPMIKHIRRFVHNGGCVSISLNSFENEFGDDDIVMWSWCSKCQKVSPVVPMSSDTWSFSFAKYLELRFHGGIYGRRGNVGCSHSLHHDHYQYFGFKNIVASFKYTSVQLWEISLPPPLIKIVFDYVAQQEEMIGDIKTMALKGHEIYSAITEKLACASADADVLAALKQMLTKEQAIFKQKIEEVQLKLTSPTLENKEMDFANQKRDIQVAEWRIGDSLVRIKRMIVDAVEQWNTRLSECLRKKDTDKKKERPSTLDLESPSATEKTLLSDAAEAIFLQNSECTTNNLTTKKIKSLDQGDVFENNNVLIPLQNNFVSNELTRNFSTQPEIHIQNFCDNFVCEKNMEPNEFGVETNNQCEIKIIPSNTCKPCNINKAANSMADLSVGNNGEFVVSSKFKTSFTIPLDCTADGFVSGRTSQSVPKQDELVAPPSPRGHHRSQSDGTVMSQNEDIHDNKKESDKKTVKNILSQFLPSTTTFVPIQFPFGQQEHYTLPTGISLPIVVYENEPSSIVAYALNSYDYKRSLDELTGKKLQSAEQSPSPIHKRRSQAEKDRTESGDFTLAGEKSSGLLSFLRSKDSKTDLLNISPNIADTSQSDENNTGSEKSEDIKKIKSAHVEVQFQDHSCNFFCRIYYAERFAWLRSSVLPDGEEAYIRSLSRCVQWNARGGKSGSTFSKSKDDRFILKELPKSEIQLFLDSAQNYFSYMQRCLNSSQPTLLGKIVGIYQIIFRNLSTNATLRTNLLVMENLFYNRTVTHKFDLKGSMRNRLVNPDNQDGEIVLLDENLLKMTCDAPLYILPHSKAVLTAAIQNDTEFLSDQSVMDYSLLVGLDSDNKELVLGIIDYIRTFTWDKKLETMVKKSGILGGQGKLPTIISPEEYRKRFIEAMHRYFLEVPDHWAGLGKGLEC